MSQDIASAMFSRVATVGFYSTPFQVTFVLMRSISAAGARSSCEIPVETRKADIYCNSLPCVHLGKHNI